jgi:menaquinone-specific isochorismate synthase
MKDCAFLRLPDGRAWFGWGPFAESAEPPASTCFYVNDFSLGDPKPWKTPERLVQVANAGDLEAAEIHPPRVCWEKPETEWFKMAFRRIRRDVLGQRLRKMVPVLTERGKLQDGHLSTLITRVLEAPLGLWSYAFVRHDNGFLGATPELLLDVENRTLRTMALAGTAKPNGAESFVTDAKEIEEHELVAGFLVETLAEVGKVTRGPREVSDAAGLTHFRTELSVALAAAPDLNALVRRLHPTPAVGVLPRDEMGLAKLMEYRRQLGAPAFFGAPFGLLHEGKFHCVVAIRGLGWNGREVALPSGCGIVGGSAFDHEWRELRLKREAVAALLGL